MSFLSNSTWWILFVSSNILMAALAIRETFRFRSMNSSYGKSTTLLAFLALPAWLILIVVMIVLTGWLSAFVGLTASFIFGQIVLRASRFLFPGEFRVREMFAQVEFERKIAKTSIDNAALNPNVRELMRRLSLEKKDIEDVYDRLRAVGLEHNQAEAAIRNPKIIE